MELKDLVTLGIKILNADASAPVSYSFGDKQITYEAMNEKFISELNALAGTHLDFMENAPKIYTLMEQIVDDVLPKRVLEQWGRVAEVKQFNQGDKPVFYQRITEASKRRAKQFITKVGLAGRYEVFKLDGKSWTVPTSAYGGAAQISIEELLDKRITLSDVLDIVLEGMDEAIFLEIERALKTAAVSLQPANKHSASSFDETQMDRLLSVADSYGKATIFCTYEFAATMVPASGDWISDRMADEKWTNGYLARYKGHDIVILDQSYEDDTNSVKVIDPAYAWIIPAGADKPVKVALEGQTIVKQFDNRDFSTEIQMYKKVGVTATITNNICVYRNTSLTR